MPRCEEPVARLPPTLVAPQGRAGRRSPTTRVGEKTGEATNSPRQDPHQAREAAPKGAGRPPEHRNASKADHYLFRSEVVVAYQCVLTFTASGCGRVRASILDSD